jgi:hypothetical protein
MTIAGGPWMERRGMPKSARPQIMLVVGKTKAVPPSRVRVVTDGSGLRKRQLMALLRGYSSRNQRRPRRKITCSILLRRNARRGGGGLT